MMATPTFTREGGRFWSGPWLAVLVAVLWSGILAVVFPYQVTDDAQQYERLARNILAGHGFSSAESAPFSPTMYREPGYPLFLSGIFLMTGGSRDAVRAVQIGVFAFTVWLVYRVTRRAFDEMVARAAALGTALAPPLANYPSYLLSETWFTMLLAALVWALLGTVSAGRRRWFLLAGALWGLATLCKGATLLLLIPIAVVWAVVHQRRGIRWRRRAVGYALFLVSGSLLLAPWMIRNQMLFGQPAIALRGGEAVWDRSQRLEYSRHQIVQTIVFSVSEFLGQAMFPHAVERPRDFLLRESAMGNERIAALKAQGLSEAQVDRWLMREGLARIRVHPFRYLSQSLLEALKMTVFLYVPVLNEPAVQRAAARMHGGSLGLSVVRGALHLLALAVLVFAALGAYRRRAEWERWVFIALPIVGVIVPNSLLFGSGRYAVPVAPYYLMFGIAGWLALYPPRLMLRSEER